MIDGILHWVRTGVQWRHLPERFGPWSPASGRGSGRGRSPAVRAGTVDGGRPRSGPRGPTYTRVGGSGARGRRR
ncbi:transposase [Streptomyces sp. GS7]|uniref:transposase n=1 Tax=Streptomyces sp. GS7 TaxID=2692234 RepID=UPI003FA77CD9